MKYGMYREKRKSKSANVLLLLLITVFAVCAAWFLWRVGEYTYDVYCRSSRYDTLILQASLRNHIDPLLVKAVIWRESGFDRTARGLHGEIGLMQIIPEYAVADWAVAHKCKRPNAGALFDPALNIDIGSWYLSRALQKYRYYKDAEALALCEYNAGAKRVAAWKPANPQDPVIDRITIPSTKAYVKTILIRYQQYKKQQITSNRKEHQ